MNPAQRAASQWRDRRLVKKYGPAATLMNAVDHADEHLKEQARTAYTPQSKEHAASSYRLAASILEQVDPKTNRRANKLNKKPALRNLINKKLGLKSPEETKADLSNLF